MIPTAPNPECSVTDAQIAAMTPRQRRELIARLERPVSDLSPPERVARARRLRLAAVIAATLALIPWTVFLAVTLPDRHLVTNWALTWVGFDVLLVVLMVTTVYLALRRRMLALLSAFATAVMLICDAWFDVTTAGADGRIVAVCFALVAELPLAALLILGTLRTMQVMAHRLWLLRRGESLWRLELPVEETHAVALSHYWRR